MDIAISALLAWIHILAAIGWMGTAMFLVNVLSPSMVDLSPASRKELVLKLFPRFIRYVTAFATLTIAAGAILAFYMVDFQLDQFAGPRWMRVSIGATLALIAYVLAMGVGLRSARKMVRILTVQQPSQQGPSPEIPALQRRMRIAATTVVALLAVALVFMVAAARL